ncbi:MAG TPA: hypothetical protein VJL29_11385 [Thermoguttaceae bacterium]|nr:hypothetical protein [Thermoguttaceae bacterium]
MKGKVIFGALVLSVVLAGQGFGFELLNDLLGINQGRQGCNACCEPACCEKACAPACCEKACPQTCEPACQPACEPACCEPCCKPRCDLFAGLKGLFACKKCCCEPCGNAWCEPKCCPEPKCCEKQCCEQNCCEPACEPACNTCCKHRCTPVRDLLDDLCSLRICVYKTQNCNACCEPACCEQPGCCDTSCGCGNGSAPAGAPKTAPARELPKAPPMDTSASVQPNKYYRVSRSIVR